MPDDRLSALAAGLAQTVCGYLRRDEAPEQGTLRVGHILSDGLSQSWTSAEIEPRIVVRSGAVEVRISQGWTPRSERPSPRVLASRQGG